MEHLMFKGSSKYSCRDIKESIEGRGGSLNGFTSEELTCYLVKLPARYFSLAFDVLSDMVRNPLLLKTDINKERTVILEEAKMYKDLPQSYVHELLDELLWPGHPLGKSIIGTTNSINRIDKSSLQAFKNRFYVPSEIVVSAAGQLDHEKLVKMSEKIFGPCQKAAENKYEAVKTKQANPLLKILSKETEQTHLALGFHGYNRTHPLRYGLRLLHIILGANMSSRLFDELREKRGLAYEIGTQIKRFYDTGAFVVHAGIDNSKVSESVDLILNELNKIKCTPVKEDELRRAKEFFLGQLVLSLEDTLDQMLWIGESISALDIVHSLEEVTRHINKVSPEDIREIACDIFKNEEISLALIGPFKDGREKIYSRLHLG